MKQLLAKAVPVVLVLTLLVPRPALAIAPFDPFDQHMADLDAALTAVIAEMDTVIGDFADSKKIVKSLAKAQTDLAKARDALRAMQAPGKDSSEFPQGLKKVVGSVKKGLGGVDKAFKASNNDSALCSFVCSWGALILVPLFAIVAAALSLSLMFHSQFSRGLEKKHIKVAAKMGQALLLLGMTGAIFVPALFAWGPDTKKGIGLLGGALKLSILLILFIAANRA